MIYKRSVIKVTVRLDPAPGWNHQPEDMVKHIEGSIPEWYKPIVKLVKVEFENNNKEGLNK